MVFVWFSFVLLGYVHISTTFSFWAKLVRFAWGRLNTVYQSNPRWILIKFYLYLQKNDLELREKTVQGSSFAKRLKRFTRRMSLKETAGTNGIDEMALFRFIRKKDSSDGFR